MSIKRRDGLLEVRRQLRGCGSLHDMNLSVCAITDRLVFESHVVRKDMNLSSLFGGDVVWKHQDLARRVVSEQCELGVVVQGFGVVQVNVP